MNDSPDTIDPLEAELAAMRPAEPSAELLNAIGRRLARHAAPRRTRWWIGGAVAAAACLVLAAAVWRAATVRVAPDRIAVTVPPPGATDDRPALSSYRHASSMAPAELDELLDRHAARTLAGGGGHAVSASVTASSGLFP